MRLITFDEFIANNQEKHPEATGELSGLLRDIGLASKIVNRDLSKAGLVDAILGDANEINIQGEDVKKLDLVANETLKKCFQSYSSPYSALWFYFWVFRNQKTSCCRLPF